MTVPTPLTFQQSWMWNLARQYPEWKCVGSYGLRLRGVLDVPALRRSLEMIIARHGSLRTRITLVGEIPLQQADDPRPYPLECETVAGTSAMEREANARGLLETLCDMKWDLLDSPLLQVRLLRLSAAEHWLLIAAHRLVADCFSMDRVLPELLSQYAAEVHHRPAAPAIAPLQYGDYSRWQQDTSDEWLGRHGPYWKRRLEGATNLQWPGDSYAAQAPRGTLGRMNTLLGAALSEHLRELARLERTLLANAMLAVYVAALWRWCRQNDFILPFFVAGRQSEHKSVVGYFSHILYLRMEVTGEESFSTLLRYVSNEFFRALAHQDFGRMATQQPRLLEGTFFQWLTWHEDDTSPTQISSDVPDLTVERVFTANYPDNITAIPPGMVNVEMTFFDTSRGIYASGVYRADLFSSDTIQRFIEILQSTTRLLAQDPHARLATLFATTPESSRSVPCQPLASLSDPTSSASRRSPADSSAPQHRN